MSGIITLLVVITIATGIAVLITRESRRVRVQKGLPPPQGFRGWLLVLAILETIRPIGTVRAVAQYWLSLPALEAKISLAVLFPDLLIQLFTLVAMYRSRRYFRFAYLAQSAVTLLICGLGALGTSWNAADAGRLAYVHGQIVGAAMTAIISTIYVFRSERVRNTFIRPLPVAADIAKVF